MNKTYLKILTILISIGVFTAGSFANISKANAQVFRGLIIDQTLMDFDVVNPGEIVKGSFTVTHDYEDVNATIIVYLKSKDFTSGERPGIPVFLEKSSVPEASRVSDWIEFDKESITLTKRGQVETVNFTITIPIDAEPGGKYAAILLSNLSGEEAVVELNGPGFGLNSELGPLIFLIVNGNIVRDLQVKDIYTTNVKGKRQKFFFNPPVNVVIEFENTGNVHVSPVGRVYIHKGDDFTKYYSTYELNPNESYILPGTTRAFSFAWDDSFISTQKISLGDIDSDGKEDYEYSLKYDWDKLSKLRIGNYNASIQFAFKRTDGTSANPPILNVSFLIIPWQLLALVAIIILLIWIIIIVKALKNKHHKKSGLKYDQRYY